MSDCPNCERLTRERDQWKERHDRERAAHATNLTQQQKCETERDRLRAALAEAAWIIRGKSQSAQEWARRREAWESSIETVLSGESSSDETSGCAACDRGVLTPHDVETSPQPIAPGIVDGVRHYQRCACLYTPAGEAARRACDCGAAQKASERSACKSCDHVPAPGQSLLASGNCLVCEAL